MAATYTTSAEDVKPELNKCSSSQISDLAHDVAHHIYRGKPQDYNLYSKIWSLEEWWHVTDYLDSLFATATKQAWTKDQVFEHLGSIPDSTKVILYGVINVHKDALRRHLLDQTTAISHNVLTDFDWQLKLVMSSDKLSSLNTPLLNLDLQIKDSTSENKVISLEMDQKDLKKLISSLDNAGKASCAAVNNLKMNETTYDWARSFKHSLDIPRLIFDNQVFQY